MLCGPMLLQKLVHSLMEETLSFDPLGACFRVCANLFANQLVAGWYGAVLICCTPLAWVRVIQAVGLCQKKLEHEIQTG